VDQAPSDRSKLVACHLLRNTTNGLSPSVGWAQAVVTAITDAP
jgi:hypothetical protein